jgi:hypothetical protein
MELLESHFSNIGSGSLNYDKNTNEYSMFSGNGESKHLNYISFKELFNHMINIKNPVILETGIASAGTNSTLLFNEYVRKYGGHFWSVDINNDLVQKWQGSMCPATKLVNDDSVSFLNNWVSNNPTTQANVVYLDSYDLDWYSYLPAAQHGLKEFNAIRPALKENSLLLVDDTPLNPYWLDTRDKLYSDMCNFYFKNNFMPGKGLFILNEIPDKKILHTYQTLYKF